MRCKPPGVRIPLHPSLVTLGLWGSTGWRNQPYLTTTMKPGNSWSDGRAVEGASLLRKYTGNGIRGSNPRHSEKSKHCWLSNVCLFCDMLGFEAEHQVKPPVEGLQRRRPAGGLPGAEGKSPSSLFEIVAQLDRASDCGSEGQKFESSRSRKALVAQEIACKGFSLPYCFIQFRLFIGLIGHFVSIFHDI